MQIERLRLVIEESEAVDWALRLLEGNEAISGAHVGFENDAVIFEGRIRIPFAGEVPFRTHWTVEIEASGRLAICLAQASAFGWSGGSGFLSGMIMERIRDRLSGRAGCEVAGDRVILDPVVLLAALPVNVRLHITSVSVEPGRLVLETA
jgi:hypothetical protein